MVNDDAKVDSLVKSTEYNYGHQTGRQFLQHTSTSPPLSTTSLKSRYMSKGCLAIIGILVMGVPAEEDHSPTLKACGRCVYQIC